MSGKQRPKAGRVQAPIIGTVVRVGDDLREERLQKIVRALDGFLTDLPGNTPVRELDRRALAEWLYLVVRAGA